MLQLFNSSFCVKRQSESYSRVSCFLLDFRAKYRSFAAKIDCSVLRLAVDFVCCKTASPV